jgi:hypothetical protein
MAAMQAVEIADRENRPGRVMRPGTGMSNDADHSGRMLQWLITGKLPPK